jgi:hypothetical protein
MHPAPTNQPTSDFGVPGATPIESRIGAYSPYLHKVHRTITPRQSHHPCHCRSEATRHGGSLQEAGSEGSPQPAVEALSHKRRLDPSPESKRPFSLHPPMPNDVSSISPKADNGHHEGEGGGGERERERASERE